MKSEGETVSPPSIVQYWHADDLPRDVREATSTYARLNPRMRHIVFSRRTATDFISEHFSARELDAFRRCLPGAMQADYFRLCGLYVLGGVYADADLKCVRSVESLLHGGTGVMFGRVDDELGQFWSEALSYPYRAGDYPVVGNGFFAFGAARERLLATAIELATCGIERRIADGPKGIWLTAGPGVFPSLYMLRELGSIAEFRRYTQGTALEASAEILCEIVDSAEEVAAMLSGVNFRPRAESRAWVRPVRVSRAARAGDAHWQVWRGTIYAE
jgi:hypothetical protein